MGSAEPVDTGIDHEVIGVAADTEIDILAAETSPTPLSASPTREPSPFERPPR